MSSRAADLPPELFESILSFVGDEDRLDTWSDNFDPAARREEIKHLSACALTCLYWAQLTRQWIFQYLVLRSSSDFDNFQSFIRASSPRITPIGDMLEQLMVIYTLGDRPWFHTAAMLVAEHYISLDLHIIGPATPGFIDVNTQRPVLHPLSFSAPRILRASVFKNTCARIHIQNIHLPNSAVLFNLVQDCLLLMQPSTIHFTNVTWNDTSANSEAAIPLPAWKFVYSRGIPTVRTSGCTDPVLLEAMAHSIPHRAFFQRGQDVLHLNLQDTLRILHIMRVVQGQVSSKPMTAPIGISAIVDFELRDGSILPQYPAGHTMSLSWRKGCFFIRFCASRPLDNLTGASNVNYVVIRVAPEFLNPNDSEQNFVDWDAFLDVAQRFPDLRRIIFIQWTGDPNSRESENTYDTLLPELVAHLGEKWIQCSYLLNFRRRMWNTGGWPMEHYKQVELETLLRAIRRKVEEAQATVDAASSSDIAPTDPTSSSE